MTGGVASLHLLVEVVQPLVLSTDTGPGAHRGQGTHLGVTSVLWQIPSPASPRTTFELSMGRKRPGCCGDLEQLSSGWDLYLFFSQRCPHPAELKPWQGWGQALSLLPPEGPGQQDLCC